MATEKLHKQQRLTAVLRLYRAERNTIAGLATAHHLNSTGPGHYSFILLAVSGETTQKSMELHLWKN